MDEPQLFVDEKHLEIVLAILREHVPATEVWAFGSRVGGRVKPYSDLDLAIINEEPLSLQLLGRLKDAFSESNLPYRVDIIDWASTDDAFRSIVAAKKAVILSR